MIKTEKAKKIFEELVNDKTLNNVEREFLFFEAVVFSGNIVKARVELAREEDGKLIAVRGDCELKYLQSNGTGPYIDNIRLTDGLAEAGEIEWIGKPWRYYSKPEFVNLPPEDPLWQQEKDEYKQREVQLTEYINDLRAAFMATKETV